jgi:hypothetical protein
LDNRATIVIFMGLLGNEPSEFLSIVNKLPDTQLYLSDFGSMSWYIEIKNNPNFHLDYHIFAGHVSSGFRYSPELTTTTCQKYDPNFQCLQGAH